jgi:hypothetical protein
MASIVLRRSSKGDQTEKPKTAQRIALWRSGFDRQAWWSVAKIHT